MERFAGRILTVDQRVANAWGRLVTCAKAVGRPIGIMDGFIAATAEVTFLTVVTRNTSEFVQAGVATHNPWHGEPRRPGS